MERFKLKYIREDCEWGGSDEIQLMVKVHYKNCWNISRSKYVRVGYVSTEHLTLLKLSTKEEILKYLVEKYIEERAKTKLVRNIRRIY